MAISTLDTATGIINRVAAEVGITPVIDPYASTDPSFIKLKYLLDIAAEELVEAHPWEQLLKTYQITTVAAQGSYALPADFAYMMNQTGWERSNRVPLGGPLSPQEWAMLNGRDQGSNQLYISFRISEGMFKTFPTAPTAGLDINFEYMSNAWARSGTEPYVYTSSITEGSQTPLIHRTLLSRYVKLKFLDATGFDTTKAQDDFNQMFAFLTGTEKGAPVLNAGRSGSFPYLGALNVPDTGFGL